MRGRRRRVRDLGDEVGGGRLGDAVDQHAQQGDLQEDVKPDAETEEHALPIVEPVFLLLPGEAHAREVGFELCLRRRILSVHDDDIPCQKGMLVWVYLPILASGSSKKSSSLGI